MRIPKLNIFVSSPNDVADERKLAEQVITRLAQEFAGEAELQAVLWEQHPMEANASFQEQIDKIAGAGIFVCILWARMGSPLDRRKLRSDGTQYESGTAYEFEVADKANRQQGEPILLVYRKAPPDAPPKFPTDREGREKFQEWLRQLGQVDAFFERWFVNSDDTNRRAYNAFKEAAEFEGILESHLRTKVREWIDNPRQHRRVAARQRYEDWGGGPPFRGLNAFQFNDAGVFFGRREATEEILERIRGMLGGDGASLLIVHGTSGCGKSSLVQAGVLPLLVNRDAIPEVAAWRYGILRPGRVSENPFTELAAALLADTALPELARAAGSPEEFAGRLRESPDLASVLVSGFFLSASPSRDRESAPVDRQIRLVLVVDQLEEIFTSKQFHSEDRIAWVRALFNLSANPNVCVVCTLRDDFNHSFAELAEQQHFQDRCDEYRLKLPAPLELQEMIRAPAWRAGLEFDVDRKRGPLDEFLCHTADPRSLPLLEFTLDELYNRREESSDGSVLLTYAALDELGGVAGALTQRADGVRSQLRADFSSRGIDLDVALESVFRMLTAIGSHGDRLATRLADLSRVRAVCDGASDLVDAFIEARLFSTDAQRGASPVVQVAHEALLAHWQPLLDWAARDRQWLLIRERLEALAAQWVADTLKSRQDRLLQAGKPLEEAEALLKLDGADVSESVREFVEASRRQVTRQETFRRLGYSALAVAFVAAILFGGVAWWQKREADGQRAAAEAAQEAERKARVEALGQKDEADAARDAALAARSLEEAAKQRAVEALRRETEATRLAVLAQESAEAARDEASRAGERERQAKEDALQARDEARSSQREEQEQRRIAEEQRAKAEAGRYQIQLARVTDLRQDDPELAMELLLSSRECPPELRDFTWSFLLAVALDAPAGVGSAASPKPATLPAAARSRRISAWQSAAAVHSMALSPDAAVVACGCHDGVIRLCDRATGAARTTLAGHVGPVWSLAYSAAADVLVSGGQDRTVRVWSTASGRLLHTLAGHSSPVVAVDVARDGRTILSGAGPGPASAAPAPPDDAQPISGEIKQWSLPSGEELRNAALPATPVRAAAFLPGTDDFVWISIDGATQRFAAATGQAALWPPSISPVEAREKFPAGALAVSSGGRVFASAALSESTPQRSRLTLQRLALPAAAAGPVVPPPPLNEPPPAPDLPLPPAPDLPPPPVLPPLVRPLDDAPPNAIPNAAAEAPPEAVDLSPVQFGHRSPVLCLAISSDGRTLATGDRDGRIVLRDTVTGAARMTLREHAAPVRLLAFADSGAALASCSGDVANQAASQVVVYEGLTETARYLAEKASHWREAHDVAAQMRELGVRGGTSMAVESAAMYVAAIEAELAWAAGNRATALRRLQDAERHAAQWSEALSTTMAEFPFTSSEVSRAIELRGRMKLGAHRLRQLGAAAVSHPGSVESSRLPVLHEVTGGVAAGKTPADERALLAERVQVLEEVFRRQTLRLQVGVGDPIAPNESGFKLEIARAAVSWAGGSAEDAAAHLREALAQCEAAAAMLERRFAYQYGEVRMPWHTLARTVDIKLSLSRILASPRGASLADVISRTSLERTGKIDPPELDILQGVIEQLDQPLLLIKRMVEYDRVSPLELEAISQRVEHAKADLAWARGDREATRKHLESAVAHGSRLAEMAGIRAMEAQGSDREWSDAAIAAIDSKLALARLARIAAAAARP